MSANSHRHILVFTLDGRRYGLPLAVVERVLRSVAINPVPTSSETVMGLLNLHGRIIPVLNIRKLLSLAEREVELNDRLVIAHTRDRVVTFPVDDVTGIVECPDGAITASNMILPEPGSVEGIAVFDDDMVLIYDLERFLTVEEGSPLFDSLSSDGGRAPAAGEQEGAYD